MTYAYKKKRIKLIVMKKRSSTERVLMVLLFALLLCSCKSKQIVATETSTQQIKIKDDNNEDVFLIPDVLPVFNDDPSGEDLTLLIRVLLDYPEEAFKKRITGRVFVKYVVDVDGSVTNARIMRGFHPLLDEEALRVINLLPKFTPGTYQGKPVKVQLTIPINFQLPDM